MRVGEAFAAHGESGMHNTSDISSLYREFGGDPRNYREIGQETRAAAARGRWPLLGRIRPGALAVPAAVGGRSDPPARVAPWPPAAVATLALPPAPGYPPVRAGAAVDAERALALVRGARVQRIALDALVLPVVPPEATKPEAPVAAPAGPAAVVQAAPRLEPSLAPADPPPPPFASAAAEAALAALPPAEPVAAVTPAAEPAPVATAATSLQSVFARLAKAPGAGQAPPTPSTAKE